jgi:hypothetical protein
VKIEKRAKYNGPFLFMPLPRRRIGESRRWMYVVWREL